MEGKNSHSCGKWRGIKQDRRKLEAVFRFQPKALRWLGFKVNLLIYSCLPFLNANVGTHE